MQEDQVLGRLPRWTTSCVGRGELLEQAFVVLQSVPVLTITGGAGIGKTTLALELARSLCEKTRGGVWWVGLGETLEPDSPAQAVAVVLGLRNQTAQSAEDVLVDYLRGHDDLVLVLDNCEHLVASVAPLVDAIVQEAPRVRVIATSRVRLRVGSEFLLAVPPLALPHADDAETPLNELGRVASVQVLCSRAAAVAPGFALNATTRRAVAELVRRLDGIPLAIEIAAARLRALGPDEIAERGDELFQVLAAGGVVPTCHVTLWDSVEWSYRLCSEGERAVWARASVFADGWDLRAAEAVCAGGGIAAGQVADLVAGLVEASVLIRHPDGLGRSRFRLLEPMRQFGAHQLHEVGEEPVVRERHLTYYAELVAETAAQRFSPQEVGLMTRLGAEMANVRSAIRNATEDGNGVLAKQMALGLAQTSLPHVWGALTDLAHWLDDHLVPTPVPLPPALRSAAMDLTVFAMARTGEPEQADRVTTSTNRRERDPLHKYLHGTLALFSHGDPASIGLLKAANQDFAGQGQRGPAHMCLLMLSMAISTFGQDGAEAKRVAQRCIAEAQLARAPWSVLWGHWVVGLAELLHGSPRQALSSFRAALRSQRDLDPVQGCAVWSAHGVTWAQALSLAGDQPQATETAAMHGICHRLRARAKMEIIDIPLCARIHQRAIERTQDVLGKQAFDDAFRLGLGIRIDGARPSELAWAMALGEQVIPIDKVDRDAPPLTRRQWRLVQMVGTGLTSRQIAARLDLSVRTVDNTVRMIYDRLDWNRRNSRPNLAAWAVDNAELVARKVDNSRSGASS